MGYSEILRTVDQFGYAAAESSAGANTIQKIPLYRTLSPILEPTGPLEPGIGLRVLLERLGTYTLMTRAFH